MKNYLYICPCCGLKIYTEKELNVLYSCERCCFEHFKNVIPINLKETGPCRICIHWNDNNCTCIPLLPLSLKNIKLKRLKIKENDGNGCECFDYVI